VWVAPLAGGRAFGASPKVGFRENEEDASAALSGFAAYDPPEGTTAVVGVIRDGLPGVIRDIGDLRGDDLVHRDADRELAALLAQARDHLLVPKPGVGSEQDLPGRAGLLIDALMLRTVLVPALVAIVGEHSGWPGRSLLQRAAQQDPPQIPEPGATG